MSAGMNRGMQIGDFDFAVILRANRVLAPVLFCSFVIFCLFYSLFF